MYVWHIVDGEGEVLEILVQPQRDKAAVRRRERKMQGFKSAKSAQRFVSVQTAFDQPSDASTVCAGVAGVRIRYGDKGEGAAENCQIKS
jgi:transposase-like protein